MFDYDIAIIGAGSGGLTAAEAAVKLGVRVALVEKDRIGGDCTWQGCIPSKALMQVARVAHAARTAAHYGIQVEPPRTDMKRVRDYIHETIHAVADQESAEVLAGKGMEVVLGAARFVDAHTIQVGERRLTARKFILSTGAHAWVPPVLGLDTVPYITYEQVFDLETLPERLVVLGAGPTGAELAQAFQRLGSQVTLIDRRVMPREDPAVADVMQRVFEREGIHFMPCLESEVRMDGETIVVNANGQMLPADCLLVATGRRPNVNGLDLENADIAYSEQGIAVDQYLRTSAKHIYAVGDCNGGHQFTHYAGLQAFQAVRNAFLPGNASGFPAVVAWATFTDPEVAQVGLTEAAARAQFGDAVQVTRLDNTHIDRSLTDNDRDGFIKIVYKSDGTLLGATVVAARAGEIINEFALAMENGLGIAKIASATHVYPTYNTAVQLMVAEMAADKYLSGTTGKIIRGLTKMLA